MTKGSTTIFLPLTRTWYIQWLKSDIKLVYNFYSSQPNAHNAHDYLNCIERKTHNKREENL